jgi:hypothetical protein
MGFGTTNLVVVRQLLQAALDGHNSQEQGARAAVTHVIRSDIPGDNGTSTSHGSLYEYLQNTPLGSSGLTALRGRVTAAIAQKSRRQGVEEEEVEERGGGGGRGRGGGVELHRLSTGSPWPSLRLITICFWPMTHDTAQIRS